MNIEYREIKNENEWDNFVRKQDRYSFVQSYKYSNVIKSIVGKIERIGVYRKGELIGVLPISIITAKRGRYIRLRHGPVLNNKGWNYFKEINEYLNDYAVKNNCNFIRIQPVLETGDTIEKEGYKLAPTHNLDAEHTLQLSLKEKTEENLLANMRKNTRYYIRKSQKEGIEVIKDKADFETFFSILKQTASRQSYVTWPRVYFESLFDQFCQQGLSLYFATYQKKKVAIGLFLDYGNYRFYLEGGMLMQYSKFYPAYAIQWESIKDALNKGIEVYDFWGGVSPKNPDGSPLSDYPWAGIDLFKRGFGGEEKSIMHPHDLQLNWKYKLTYYFEAFERWKRGY